MSTADNRRLSREYFAVPPKERGKWLEEHKEELSK
jgi:hypothetical protein